MNGRGGGQVRFCPYNKRGVGGWGGGTEQVLVMVMLGGGTKRFGEVFSVERLTF